MDRIQHPTAVGSEPAYTPTGTEGYATDGDPGAGTPATIFPAAYWNMLQEELMTLLAAAGITPDFSDRTQVLEAIRLVGKGSNFGTTTNVSNAYSVDTTPEFDTLADGQTLALIFNATNTGAPTLDVNSIGAKDLVKASGAALNAGDIVAGTIYFVVYDGTDFRLNTVDAVTADGINAFTGDNSFAGKFGLPDAGELTISGGEITITGASHTVDTEGDAASDDLNTINGGSDGDVLVLAIEADARTVTLTDSGNIALAGDSIEMASTSSPVTLIYNGTTSKWIVVSGAPTKAGEVPIGAKVEFVSSAAVPSNYLIANGASFNQLDYPLLYTALGDSNTLPDLRGEFIRGLDLGRGVDSGRSALSFQADQMEQHSHGYYKVNEAGGLLSNSGSSTNAAVRQTTNAGGTSNSSENRPRNVALVFAIRAE